MKYLSKIIKGFEKFCSNLFNRCPPLRTVTKRAFYLRFLFWRWRVKAKDYNQQLSVDKVYWINPKIVIYSSLREFDTYRDKKTSRRVMSGNWDSLERKITDSFEYQKLKNNITHGKKVKSDACGLVSSSASKSEMNAAFDVRFDTKDEIKVNIGRYGDLLLNSGMHALSTAKLLGIQWVPIRIVVRHSKWQQFRKEICALGFERRLYQPITHPDLSDIPAEHQCEDRFNIIRKNMHIRKGRLLDIGANFGYFCHRFEELGFECYAIENDLEAIYFLKRLRRAENREFRIISRSIFEWEYAGKLEFEVVLALNVFHHFLKNKTTYLEFISLLKKLKMKQLFFEPHLVNEPQMKNAYKNYSEEEFVEFILQNSKLKNAKLIGVSQDGRSLYKLY